MAWKANDEGLLYIQHFSKYFLHIWTNLDLRIPFYGEYYYQPLLWNEESLNNLHHATLLEYGEPGVWL